MRRILVAGVALAVTAGIGGITWQSAAAADGSSWPVRSCESLALLNFADGTKVTSATQQSTEPATCQVTLLVPDSINVLVMLPVSTWNGRFQGVGGGGYAGTVTLPVGYTPLDAAKAGYAAASTDTGHRGSFLTGEWAWSPTGMRWNLIQDFGYRSLHEMTVKGKAVTEAYYGRAPAYSYWNGCSTGGRQGLMEAQRYPEDYDGVLSAAPAINWDRFIPAELWPQVVMQQEQHFVAGCKFEAINAAVTAACDDRDGVTDGVIDPRQCDLDPASLVGTQTPCGPVTEADAAVVRKIWQGPRRSDGSLLWYGLPPGAPFTLTPSGTLGLANTVSVPDGTAVDGLPFQISHDWFKWWLAKDPAFDWHGVTYESFPAYFDQSREEYHDVLGTDDPDLSRFRDAGGKLIIWHGWADDLIFAQGTVDYYQRVIKQMGGAEKTARFARLFMAPGVYHCSGGPGAAPTDPLAALVKWVERGEAPATLAARNAETTRPLCPWPKVARHNGGDPNDAANFRCARDY